MTQEAWTEYLESVMSYQSKNNLSADGIIGVNTWRKLMSDVVGKGPGTNTVN